MNGKFDYNTIYQQIFHTEPPQHTILESSKAGIFTPGRGFMSDFDYTMQLQVGCPGGCLFCYVPAADQFTPKDVKGPHGQNWGFLIRNKKNVLGKLKKYLYQGELADKTIYWSGVTDPYAAPPATTRGLWQILNNTPMEFRPKRIAIQTRFNPSRDVELLQAYNESTVTSDGGPPVLVSYSIGTDRNDLIRAWEKSTPLFEQRVNVIERLRQARLFVVATLSPLGLWNDLSGTLEKFKALGVSYITYLFFKENTASANTSLRFLQYLHKQYPVVLNREWQEERVQEMRTIYGGNSVRSRIFVFS